MPDSRNPEVGEEAVGAVVRLRYPNGADKRWPRYVERVRAQAERDLAVAAPIIQCEERERREAVEAERDVLLGADQAEAALDSARAEERERIREVVGRFYADAVRSKIVAEEQGEDSSVASIRVNELREVLAALDSPASTQQSKPKGGEDA